MDIDDNIKTTIDNPKPVVLSQDSLEMLCVEGTESEIALRMSFRLAEDRPGADSSDRFLCLVDTSSVIPKLTLHADLVPTGQYYDAKNYAIQRLKIRIDSLPIDGERTYNLNRAELKAYVLYFKKVNGRQVDVIDTVVLRNFDDYNFGFLNQNVVSAKHMLRLSLDYQVLSTTVYDGKRRVARLRAVTKIRY